MLRCFFRIFLYLGIFSETLTGQETFQPKQLDPPNKGIVYNQELAIGLRLHTNGFSFGINSGKLLTYYKTKYWLVEIGELQHVKEYRQTTDTPSPLNGRISRAYKYGKQNSFFVLRGGIGTKRYYSEKAKHKGVAVGIAWDGGFTLGLLKPYYLEIRDLDGRFARPVRYSQETADRFLNEFLIHGASPWTKGLNEITLQPGIHGKIAVHFDWGAFDQYVRAAEAGIMLDAFMRKIPMMVEVNNVENQQFFINLFLHLQFGKRW